MIVNTAYIYMGTGGAPINPNLWQDGVSNYPVEFNNSSISSNGVQLTKNGGAVTFSELSLTDFNSLTISRPSDYTSGLYVSVEIKFFNSSDQLLGTENASFNSKETVAAVNIPSSAKIQKAKISMTNKSKNNAITLVSALLS